LAAGVDAVRDSIDHPPGSHDDVARAALGCETLARGRIKGFSTDSEGSLRTCEQRISRQK